MTLPPVSGNDRRSVPRHLRDGEHEQWHDAAETPPAAPRGAARLWFYGLVLLAAAAAWWLFRGAA